MVRPKKFDPCNPYGRPNPRPCLWCAARFKADKVTKDFCSERCRIDYNTWRRQRGGEAFDMLLEFRGQRQPGGFTKVCQIIDQALAEQRDRWQTFEQKRKTDAAQRT